MSALGCGMAAVRTLGCAVVAFIVCDVVVFAATMFLLPEVSPGFRRTPGYSEYQPVYGFFAGVAGAILAVAYAILRWRRDRRAL
jgi:hypothetical protein